jgi:hypothetical protein
MTEVTPTRRAADPSGYANAAEVAGQPLGEIVYVIALLITAGADFAVFNQVVSLIMPDVETWLTYLTVAGFTAASLTLAHFIGRLLREAKAAHGPRSRAALWFLGSAWALLGIVAFFVRLVVAKPVDPASAAVVTGADPSVQLFTNALMFLGLYIASGTVACFGEYLTYNPLRSRYRTAQRAHRKALKRLRKSQPAYERAVSVLQVHTRGRIREQQNFEAALALRLAQADELKRYASYLMAVELQDPSATDGMTRPDRLAPKEES